MTIIVKFAKVPFYYPKFSVMCDKINQKLNDRSSCNEPSSPPCPCSCCSSPPKLSKEPLFPTIPSSKDNKVATNPRALVKPPNRPSLKVVKNINIKRPNTCGRKSPPKAKDTNKCAATRCAQQPKIPENKKVVKPAAVDPCSNGGLDIYYNIFSSHYLINSSVISF